MTRNATHKNAADCPGNEVMLMKENKKQNIVLKRLLFLALFAAMVFIGKRINFSTLVGADNQFFTFFQFFGPIAGGFLGAIGGAAAVLGAELLDFFARAQPFEPVTLLRLLPMVFAAAYFSTKKKRFGAAVSAAAIAAFLLHPVGRQAWFFSLYWTIPLIVKILPKKWGDKLFLRSLGSTFTAHAVGGAIWVWAVPMTASQWTVLIPVVAAERLLFAAGISASYIAVNTVLALLTEKLKIRLPSRVLSIDSRYVIGLKASN